jgi:hypothetical protein
VVRADFTSNNNKGKKMKKCLLIFMVVMLFAACTAKITPPDPLQNLQTAAKALNDISFAANSAVKTILIVMPNNTQDRQNILGIIGKVAEADNRGIAIVRQLAVLTPVDSQNLSVILSPVFAEFHGAIDSGLLGFKDPIMKAKVGIYIDAISASISIIETILKARTSNGFSNNSGLDQLGYSAWNKNCSIAYA